MKIRKEIICLLGSGLLIAALAGCGATKGTQIQGGQQESQQEEERQPVEGETSPEENVSPAEETVPEEDAASAEEALPTEDVVSAEEDTLPAEDAMPVEQSASIRIWGPVLRVEEGSIAIDNRSEVSFRGEMIVTVDPESTRILDGENGRPVELSELGEGEAVFVYIGQSAAMSEPPIVNASLILCKIPDDLRIPDQVCVTDMEQQSDGSFLLSADNGIQYLVPQDCEIQPYLTRNVVTLQDLQAGRCCLVWSDERRAAQKIILFAE